MTTTVLTIQEDAKEFLKCNIVVGNNNSKRKKSLLTDSFEKLDLKNARRLNEDKKDINVCESNCKYMDKNLEKINSDKKIYKLTDDKEENKDLICKYDLDFKYSSISFPTIYSKRLKKSTRLQLNMDYNIYSYLNDNVHEIYKKSPTLKLFKFKPILIKNLDQMIKLWSSKNKEKYFYQKAKILVDEYIRFKKELVFHLNKDSV